jgi:hypothetical protein
MAQELRVDRQRWAFRRTRKVIAYLGLLAEYQGTDLLLQAMQRIRQTRSQRLLAVDGLSPASTITSSVAQQWASPTGHPHGARALRLKRPPICGWAMSRPRRSSA